jgi:hypothetical protein
MSPSLADLQEPLNRNAAKVLGEQGCREFNRGVGLFAHDIGIGAFVYLRRIFDNLINEAASEAIKQALPPMNRVRCKCMFALSPARTDDGRSPHRAGAMSH